MLRYSGGNLGSPRFSLIAKKRARSSSYSNVLIHRTISKPKLAAGWSSGSSYNSRLTAAQCRPGTGSTFFFLTDFCGRQFASHTNEAGLQRILQPRSFCLSPTITKPSFDADLAWLFLRQRMTAGGTFGSCHSKLSLSLQFPPMAFLIRAFDEPH